VRSSGDNPVIRFFACQVSVDALGEREVVVAPDAEEKVDELAAAEFADFDTGESHRVEPIEAAS
jgi:hypothetical protein